MNNKSKAGVEPTCKAAVDPTKQVGRLNNKQQNPSRQKTTKNPNQKEKAGVENTCPAAVEPTWEVGRQKNNKIEPRCDEEPKTNNKRKRIRKNKDLKIATINIRGAKGKIRSLESLLTAEKINVALITETMFQNKEGYNIKGYKWIAKNRKTRNGGGVGILVSNAIANYSTEMNQLEEKQETESAWIKIEARPKAIAIGVFYGPQEKEPIEQVQNIYNNLETQIKQAQAEAETILGGDFNAKLEIKANNLEQKISRNGKMLQQLINNTNLTPLNTEGQNGLWTRVNRNNPEERSVIDYILTTPNIKKQVKDTYVDEKGDLRLKGKKETDHNTIITELKINTPRKKEFTTRWNTKNKEGWDKFNKEMNEMATTKEYDPSYTKMEKTITQILKRTIGQKKIRTDKPKKPKSENITKAKNEMKQKKKDFEEACKNGTEEEKIRTKEIYKISRGTHRKTIEEHEKTQAELRLQDILKEAKIDPNVIWKTRKRTKCNNELEYDIITEAGETLIEAEITKEYIADQYEALYQARPGTKEYEQWTEHITETVKKVGENHEKTGKTQGSEPITLKEVNKAIKKLKRNKSLGPDQIPNEIFIEANENTRKVYVDIMNNIHQNENIPPSWREGHIKRLYKGKGKKGLCSNERGITLASNFGKVYERIINERIKHIVKITDAQAGGIEGNATADHLITLKQLIADIRERKKTAYIIFLDVQKAYDKAWLDAILYVLNKNGVEGKNFQMVREMNSNLTAKIQTKFGLTREIKIKDSIRQGGVLSVIEYATLIDEISKELHQRNLGMPISKEEKLGCLLWMDDVALIHEDRETLKQMMECTNDVAKRYHIEFGAAKCKIIRIGNGPKADISLNNTQLEETNKYKYLGEIINNKGSLKDHLEELRGKTHAAVQKILIETGDKEFKGIKMRAIWELIETSIIPIITYASEGWKMTQENIKQIQTIFNNALKEILRLPQGTPTLIMLAETGFLPMDLIIKEKKINQHERIQKKDETKLIRKITTKNNSLWQREMDQLMEEYNLTPDDIKSKKINTKEMVKKSNKEKFWKRIQEEATQKSKTQSWITYRNSIKIKHRPEYMNRIGRKECSTLIRARGRMIPTKDNMKNKYTDQSCRICKQGYEETQKHIIEECEGTRNTQKQIKYEDIFKDGNTEEMRDIIRTIEEIEERLKNNE